METGNTTSTHPSYPLRLFSGKANIPFAKGVAKHLDLKLGRVDISRFKDGECYVTYKESVRGADCYVIQSCCPPVDTNLMQLLIMMDALRRTSVERITAVIPYFGYARQEKKEQPREPITARLVADMIVSAGAQRVMTMDLHAAAIQGFFNFPVDHLNTLRTFCDYFEKLSGRDIVVVSTDEGGVKKVRKVAGQLGAPIAVGYKHRPAHDCSTLTELAGDVKNKVPIIIEDMITTGGSVSECVDALIKAGSVREVYVAAAHGLLVGGAAKKLSRPEIAEVVITDTVPVKKRAWFDKLRVLSVAPLFADAIYRAHNNLSVSSIFDLE
jgi:ribose-phosphate pyrophosphokinase